ncbi:LacI family DNA-binding transcriptional regulator [Streptomyces sp. NPDC060322]|uniref:LacI family DNA-binding transcriptional regulator n=1 Tax=Streptomyces sp. NPDC060322 TaxID=3347097 RepID=UPI00365D60F7
MSRLSLFPGPRRPLWSCRVFLGGPPGNSAPDARVAGYRAALAAHGINTGSEDVIDCGLGRGAGYRSMAELLTRRSDFTAVFAGDDMVAAGALRAVADAGLRVPDDISVVGYNDIPLAQDFNPPLTTVRTRAEELGRAAVRLALRDPDDSSSSIRHVLGTHIVVRDSVGAPAAHRQPHTVGGLAPA